MIINNNKIVEGWGCDEAYRHSKGEQIEQLFINYY